MAITLGMFVSVDVQCIFGTGGEVGRCREFQPPYLQQASSTFQIPILIKYAHMFVPYLQAEGEVCT